MNEQSSIPVVTNADQIMEMTAEARRFALIEFFSHWADIDDCYIFDLTRVKEAFNVGTMHLDDFVEWDESRVTDMVDDFLDWLRSPIDSTTREGGA